MPGNCFGRKLTNTSVIMVANTFDGSSDSLNCGRCSAVFDPAGAGVGNVEEEEVEL